MYSTTALLRVSLLAASALGFLVETEASLSKFAIEEATESAKELNKIKGILDGRQPLGRETINSEKNSSSCPQSTSGNRIDSLPYWSMDFDLPCMYSGELRSSTTYKNYLFYWLAPRPDDLAEGKSNADSSPLIIYLNGGPGSTSMNALWTGNGPLRVSETGSSTWGEDFEITYDTTVSWQAAGDLLWVDQPVGTGWSTGETILTSLDEIGDEFVQFMLSFYEEHPVYKDRELVLTGESFAGKYLSYTSRAILDYNDDSSNSFQFNLNNLILSNPLVDTPTERLNQNAVGWALGFYDDFQTDQVEVLRRHCEEAPSLGTDPADMATECKNILNYIDGPDGNISTMDASHFNYEHNIDHDSFTDLFTTSDRVSQVIKALHITKTEEFARTNSTVADAIEDRENNAASVYTELLSRGLKILINVGNYDQKDGVRSTLEWIKKIDFPDRELFDLQPRKVYKYSDQFTGQTQVGGWYRHHENFTAIVVPQAGHMVPVFKPQLTMLFVENFIAKGYLYCEDDSNSSCESVASDMCTYMNDCNGNGSCNKYGKCECNADFFGADCTSSVMDLAQGSGNDDQTITASRWFYYSVGTDQGDYTVSVTSDRNVSVYVMKGSSTLPDTINFDSFIKDDTSITIHSQMMNLSTGAMIAVHIVGEPEDTTSFSIQYTSLSNNMVRNSYEFLDLAVTPTPPAPLPLSNPTTEMKNDGGLNQKYFIILGAIFGVLATVIYYQIARFYQQYRQQSRAMRIQDIENSTNESCNSAVLEDPNRYVFKKVFKTDN